MPTPCYLLEHTDEVERKLRRYTARHEGGWTCAEGWHEASTPVERTVAVWRVDDDRRTYYANGDVDEFAGDPRWPVECKEGCGYRFTDDDARQVFTELVYRVAAAVPGAALDVGAETTLRDAPDGAMWWADWLGAAWAGFDGRALCVRLPGKHDWLVDSEASNCTRKGDRTHRCWIRHGEPPYVTVDKAGETCRAGAGSIMAGRYHGFLRNGVLT